MPNYNHATLAGHLVRKPELRHTPSGAAVCEFTIAVNEFVKDGDDRVNYIDCVAWAGRAGAIAEYLDKGSPILVDGSIRQDRWETKEGQKRSKLKINVWRFEFLAPRGGSGTAEGDDDVDPDEIPF